MNRLYRNHSAHDAFISELQADTSNALNKIKEESDYFPDYFEFQVFDETVKSVLIGEFVSDELTLSEAVKELLFILDCNEDRDLHLELSTCNDGSEVPVDLPLNSVEGFTYR